MFTGDQFGQILASLLFCTVPMDLIDAKVRVSTIGQTDGGGGPADFFHRDDMFQIPHACPAVLRCDRHAQKADGAELQPEIRGEIVVPVDRGGPWGDFIRGKRLHLVAQHRGGFAKVEIQTAHLVGHLNRSIGVAPSGGLPRL